MATQEAKAAKAERKAAAAAPAVLKQGQKPGPAPGPGELEDFSSLAPIARARAEGRSTRPAD